MRCAFRICLFGLVCDIVRCCFSGGIDCVAVGFAGCALSMVVHVWWFFIIKFRCYYVILNAGLILWIGYGCGGSVGLF